MYELINYLFNYSQIHTEISIHKSSLYLLSTYYFMNYRLYEVEYSERINDDRLKLVQKTGWSKSSTLSLSWPSLQSQQLTQSVFYLTQVIFVLTQDVSPEVTDWLSLCAFWPSTSLLTITHVFMWIYRPYGRKLLCYPFNIHCYWIMYKVLSILFF